MTTLADPSTARYSSSSYSYSRPNGLVQPLATKRSRRTSAVARPLAGSPARLLPSRNISRMIYVTFVPRLFLIDGSSQMYRAYHAIRGLSGPDGRSTNAVYGFTTMLKKLLADHSPEFIAASFDLAGPTFRDQLAAEIGRAHV